jgi:hypothetical protein
VTMAVPYLWPFDFMRAKVDPAVAVNYDESGIRISLDGKQLDVSDQFRMSGKENRKKSVQGAVRVEGGEPGYEFRTRVLTAAFTFDDGFQARERGQDFSFMRRDWRWASLEQVLDGCRVINRSVLTRDFKGLFSIGEADFKAHGTRPGKLAATIQVDVYKYHATGAVPLKARERIDRGAEQAVITDVLQEGDGCAVILRERTLRLQFDRSAPAKNAYDPREKNVLYLLRNPARRELVLPNDNYDPDMSGVLAAAQRLNIRSTRLAFGGNDGHGRQGPVLDKDWLAGAELVRIEAVKVDQFQKDLVAEDLRLGTSPQSYPSENKSKAEVAAALDLIAYPENPTEESVRAYIRAIREATEGQHAWSQDDRQVAMLQKVGPEHVRMLFEEIPDSYHLRYAAPPLMDEAHKPWVIANLREYPWLADVVWKNNWTAEAREVLVRGVREQWNDLPNVWFKAVASFRDPATYGDLVNFFVSRRDRDENYATLRELDGIDLDAAVDRAWKNAKYDDEYQAREMIPIAIAYGHLDALRMGILDVLGNSEAGGNSKRGVRTAVKEHAGIEGTDEELITWFRENGGRLSFDRATKMFRIEAAK